MFMQQTIADCYHPINSNPLIVDNVANCYIVDMDVRQARAKNLSTLLRRYRSLREFAESAGLVAPHVSQMKNGARRMGDEVARRIEIKLNLSHGWMDQPHVDCQLTEIENPPKPKQPSAPVTATEMSALMAVASPRSHAALERIAQAADEGRLTNTDLALLSQIAERLASEPKNFNRLREKAKDANQNSD